MKGTPRAGSARLLFRPGHRAVQSRSEIEPQFVLTDRGVAPKLLAIPGPDEPEPLVEATRALIAIGVPEDEFLRTAGSGPVADRVDKGLGAPGAARAFRRPHSE